MVHIPVFNVEVPEPRIHDILPSTIHLVLNLFSRLRDASISTLYPKTHEEAIADYKELKASIPREFDRVLQRQLDGKIKNDDQLSSEINDASFDWYRRMIRTSVAGATDEWQEDVSARKLGLDQPSYQAAVKDDFLADLQQQLGDPVVEAEKQLSAVSLQKEMENQSALLQQNGDISTMKTKVRSNVHHTAETLAGAGVGIGLAILLVRGLAVAAKKLLKRRKAKKAAPKVGPSVRTSRASSMAGNVQPPPARSSMGSAPAAQQRSQTKQSTPASAASTPPKQSASEDQAGKARAARPAAKRR